MPNWCHNKLTIMGPEADVRSFKEKATGRCPWLKPDETEVEVLNFHSLVPVPDEVLAVIFHGGVEQRSGERVRRLVNTEPNETATHRFFEDRL